MKKLTLFLQLLAGMAFLFSCTQEELQPSEIENAEINAEALGLASEASGLVLNEEEFKRAFVGDFTVIICNPSTQDEFDPLQFSTKFRKNELRLTGFQGVNPKLNFEADVVNNQVTLITPEYTITGRLDNSEPVFDVFFDEYNYCSNPPTFQTLFSFDGSYTLEPCSGFEDPISFTLNTFEGGETALIILNGDRDPFEFFTNKEGNIIELEYEGYSFTGKLVDGTPEFLVVDPYDETFCSNSLDVAGVRDYVGTFQLAPCLTGGDAIEIVSVIQSTGGLLLLELNGEDIFETYNINNGEVDIEVNGIRIEGKIVDGAPRYRAFVDGTQYCQIDQSIDVLFKANIGTNISLVDATSGALVSTGNDNRDFEIFEIISLDNGTVAIKGDNGRFVSSENGTQPMTCLSETVGANETFTLEALDDGQFAIRGSNGLYVSSENGNRPVICNRENIGRWEKFTVFIEF